MTDYAVSSALGKMAVAQDKQAQAMQKQADAFMLIARSLEKLTNKS